MEFSLYPINDCELKGKEFEVDRLDLKQSDDDLLGELMIEMPLNNDKGNAKIYFSRSDAMALAGNIELFLKIIHPPV